MSIILTKDVRIDGSVVAAGPTVRIYSPEFEADLVARGSAQYVLPPNVVDPISPTREYALSVVEAAGLSASAIAASTIPLNSGIDQSIIVKSGGPAFAEFAIPEEGCGSAKVISADGSSVAASLLHRAGAVRMANSGSSIVLPSVTLPATADAGWTIGALVRIEDINTQSGTTHHSFLKIGSGSAYALLGYEGPNATNPGCLKFLMPNAAATGVSSVRSNASPTPDFAAFAPSNVGRWVWIFVRKAGAAVSETLLSPTTGLAQAASIADESITLAWGFLQDSEPADIQVYGGSVSIAGGNYSQASAALTLLSDASTTGSHDIAKVFVLQQFVSSANLNKLLTGRRPQDIGLSVTDATEIYYDIDSLTAASLLDLIGGTAASSVTMAGSDALTPFEDKPYTRKYLSSVATKMDIAFADGIGRSV